MKIEKKKFSMLKNQGKGIVALAVLFITQQ